MDHDHWTAALDDAADELLDRDECIGPPVDALALAERRCAAVAFDASQAARGRYKRLAGRPSIFLKPDDRPERVQWAAAHELGEMVAWQVCERAGIEGDAVSLAFRESLANRFASRLLLPSCWFVADAAGCDCDLFELKRTYETASHELIAYRLLDLPEPSVVAVFDQGRISRRRSNFEGRQARLFEVERACWGEAHRSGRVQRKSGGGLSVVAWPVHEEVWKREILRTTLNEDEECQEALPP